MNVLIVEDESHTSQLLQEIIEQDSEFMVTARLESVMDAVHYISKYQQNIDLMFFDIQLSDGNSFDIFNHVDVFTPIVFCTAFDEYTLQAIKNNGIDYVLKPFKEEEIHEALQKFRKLIGNIQQKNRNPIHFESKESKHYQQHFLTQYRDKSVVKKTEEVALFSVEFETVYLYTNYGDKFPLYKKLEYIESVCDPKQFFRINRQMLVSRNTIKSFEPYFNRKVILQLSIKPEEKPVVSRLKVSAFKEWLEQ